MGQVITREQSKKLEAIGATCNFYSQQSRAHATIWVGKEVVATADGQDERVALDLAIKKIDGYTSPKEKEKNQAEEIAILKKELEDLKPAPTRRRKRAGATTQSESKRALDTRDAAQDTSGE